MALPWLIVDGYNVIGTERDLSEISSDEFDAERERLVVRVAAFAEERFRPVVVFDAARNPLSDGVPHHIAGVAVIFSRAGTDADQLIEDLTHRAKRRGEEVTVVTSDAQTQWTVVGQGALRMSSAEMLRSMDDESAEDAEGALRAAGRRSRLQDRIDPATSALLSRWARGER